MKQLFILFLCCISIATFASDSNEETSLDRLQNSCSVVFPEDEFEDIPLHDDCSIDPKSKAPERVFMNPGSFNPAILLEAGMHFISQKDFEKGALLSVRAIFRAEIDARISQDVSLGGVSNIYTYRVQDTILDCNLSDEELSTWEEAKQNAIDSFECWDRNTDRDYDQTWISGHSILSDHESNLDEQDNKRIIETFYRELKGEISEEDDYLASEDDEFYFDRKTRIFYHHESKLSFFVPENIQPQLDGFGKYASVFKLTNGEYIHMDDGWSSKPQSLEEAYERAKINNEAYESDNYKSSEAIFEKCFVGNNIPAYKGRYSYSEDESLFVETNTHFVKGPFSFNFYFSSTEENEKESMENLELLLSYIKFP